MREYPYIKSIGLELECAIPNDKLGEFTSWATEKYGRRFESDLDGSVVGTENVDEPDDYRTGREFKFWSDKMSDITEFLDKAYNTYGIVTDSTCGLHLNVQPNTKKIPWNLVKVDLAHKARQQEFLDAYRERFQGNSKYWDRIFLDKYEARKNDYAIRALLDGENRPDWNKITDNARAQLLIIPRAHTYPGERYSPINLIPTNRARNAVVEFRLMPGQETNTEAKGTINWLGKTFNGMLKDMKEGKKLLNEEKIPLQMEKEEFTPEDTLAMEREGIKVRTG